MGAKRVFFPHGRNPGDRPIVDERWFPVDRVDGLNTDSERRRLVDFVRLVTGWLEEVSRANQALPARERMSAHVFYWDHLEVRQLRRMIERHMGHDDVVGLIELLVRMFPPERVLPDPDLFRSQPGTAVKEVVRHLVGLPLAHDYSLLDVANALHPDFDPEGNPYRYRLPYGFVTELSDQIPFERAYAVWRDQVMLTRQADPGGVRRKYDRQEILEGIERAVKIRLAALESVVKKIRSHYGDRLTLRKSGFSAAPPVQTRIPELSRRLVAFERLDAICQDIKNRQDRALPVDEREARFISIRGIHPAAGPRHDGLVARAGERPAVRRAAAPRLHLRADVAGREDPGAGLPPRALERGRRAGPGRPVEYPPGAELRRGPRQVLGRARAGPAQAAAPGGARRVRADGGPAGAGARPGLAAALPARPGPRAARPGPAHGPRPALPRLPDGARRDGAQGRGRHPPPQRRRRS